jgi:hypothetical protein
MDKSLDEVPLQPVGPSQPITTAVLLRALEVYEASAETQKVAMSKWLVENSPGLSLRLSLRRNGFGILLGPRSHEWRPC